MTNDKVSITDASFKTNESFNNTETEASEVWIFPKEFQLPSYFIPSQNLGEEQEERTKAIQVQKQQAKTNGIKWQPKQ